MSTPRTDSFVNALPPVRLTPDDFANIEAALRVEHQIRDLMIAWATFARTLEESARECKGTDPFCRLRGETS